MSEKFPYEFNAKDLVRWWESNPSALGGSVNEFGHLCGKQVACGRVGNRPLQGGLLRASFINADTRGEYLEALGKSVKFYTTRANYKLCLKAVKPNDIWGFPSEQKNPTAKLVIPDGCNCFNQQVSA